MNTESRCTSSHASPAPGAHEAHGLLTVLLELVEELRVADPGPIRVVALREALEVRCRRREELPRDGLSDERALVEGLAARVVVAEELLQRGRGQQARREAAVAVLHQVRDDVCSPFHRTSVGETLSTRQRGACPRRWWELDPGSGSA